MLIVECSFFVYIASNLKLKSWSFERSFTNRNDERPQTFSFNRTLRRKSKHTRTTVIEQILFSQNEFSSWDICFVWDSMVEHSDINIMWFHIHSTVLKYTHKYTHNVLLDSSSATSMRIYLLFYILDNKHNPVPWSPYTRMFNWKYKLQVCIIHLFVSCVKMRVQSRRWEAHWIAHENEVNGKCGGKVPHLCSGCVDEIRWFGLTVLWNFLLSTSISWRSSFFILSI